MALSCDGPWDSAVHRLADTHGDHTEEETMRIIILPVLIHTRGHTSTPNLSQAVASPSKQIQITANHLVQRGPLHWGLPLPTLETPTQ